MMLYSKILSGYSLADSIVDSQNVTKLNVRMAQIVTARRIYSVTGKKQTSEYISITSANNVGY